MKQESRFWRGEARTVKWKNQWQKRNWRMRWEKRRPRWQDLPVGSNVCSVLCMQRLKQWSWNQVPELITDYIMRARTVQGRSPWHSLLFRYWKRISTEHLDRSWRPGDLTFSIKIIIDCQLWFLSFEKTSHVRTAQSVPQLICLRSLKSQKWRSLKGQLWFGQRWWPTGEASLSITLLVELTTLK